MRFQVVVLRKFSSFSCHWQKLASTVSNTFDLLNVGFFHLWRLMNVSVVWTGWGVVCACGPAHNSCLHRYKVKLSFRLTQETKPSKLKHRKHIFTEPSTRTTETQDNLWSDRKWLQWTSYFYSETQLVHHMNKNQHVVIIPSAFFLFFIFKLSPKTHRKNWVAHLPFSPTQSRNLR